MSNNLAYWGRRAGAVMKDGGLGIKQQQWGAGISRDGKNTPRRFHWPLSLQGRPYPQRRAIIYISPVRPTIVVRLVP